jgi:hypothetical protein
MNEVDPGRDRVRPTEGRRRGGGGTCLTRHLEVCHGEEEGPRVGGDVRWTWVCVGVRRVWRGRRRARSGTVVGPLPDTSRERDCEIVVSLQAFNPLVSQSSPIVSHHHTWCVTSSNIDCRVASSLQPISLTSSHIDDQFSV